MHDSNPLFVDLQPPAGGLQRLQRSLASKHVVAVSHRLRFVSGSALALSLLVLATLLPGTIAQQQRTDALRSAMQTAVAPPTNGIQVSHGAAIELANGNPGVRLYLVQTTSMPAHHDSDRTQP